MTVSLRHSHEFKDYNLKKLYGVLKTYELEIQQDEEIEKGQRKDKLVALVAKNKEEEASEVVEAPSRNVRSVLFVEGGLNTNCTVKSNLFASFQILRYKTN